jgi:outer membrane protein insertion porin family
MRIEMIAHLRATFLAFALALLALPGVSQAEIHVDSQTEIKRLDFRFEGENKSDKNELKKRLSLSPLRPPSIFRRLAGILPFVPKAISYRLDPIELQENVVVLRTFLQDSGFPQAEVRYELVPEKDPNTYALTFLIKEGPELLIRGVHFRDFEGDSLRIAGGRGDEFRKVQQRLQRIRGRRWSEISRRNQEVRLTRWWQDRGFAFPRVAIHADVDSAISKCDVIFQVDPGPATVISAVTLEGNESVDDHVILRELPFDTGDSYRAKDLAEGERSIQSLDLVRLAVVAIADSSDPSRVPVNVRVSEGKHRLLSGEAGFDSDAGVSSEASWAHRNFTGGARVLTVTGVARTGWGAFIDDPDRRYRGSVTMLQPYLIDRRLSLLAGPFIERRNDVQDLSWEFGANATVVYERAPLRVVALGYEVARRRVAEYRIGFVAAGRIDLLSLLALDAQGALDSLGAEIDRSEITLTATLGTLPEPNRRLRSALFRPSIRVTSPSTLNEIEYLRMDATVQGFLPLTRRIGLAGRISGGRIYPYGKSIPTNEDEGIIAFLRLRDVAFTGGGIDDVRGWQNRLLGPKFPDVRFRQVGDSLVAFTDGYVPVGGLSRVSGSAELRLPFPGLNRSWGTHVFLDAGRVWTADERFAPRIALDEEERWFFGTGAGVDYIMSLGSIRLGLGYKLNPSLLDLVDSDQVLAAALEGRPAGNLPKNERRRFQLHLSFGSAF